MIIAGYFKKLTQSGVIPAAFAESIKSMAGLGNILVHEYTKVGMGVNKVARQKLLVNEAIEK